MATTDALVLQLPEWTQLGAVIVGALAGAVYAARRGFDIVGVFVLAVIQGCGGLLLLATLLQSGTSVVLTDGRYLGGAALASLLGFGFAGLITRFEPIVAGLESLAIGFLCTVGGAGALIQGLDPLPVVFVSVVTATGGLALRDVLAGTAPAVLRPGVFLAVAATFGAAVFVLLATRTELNFGVIQAATIVTVFATRLVSLQLGWVTRPAQDFSDRVWAIWKQ